jgi:internalin A
MIPSENTIWWWNLDDIWKRILLINYHISEWNALNNRTFPILTFTSLDDAYKHCYKKNFKAKTYHIEDEIIDKILRLESISISKCDVDNFEPLTKFKLKYLNISETGISNLKDLKSFPDLIYLCLGKSPIYNFNEISFLTNLEQLYIYSTPSFFDLQPISNLTKLKYLWCSDCSIREITPIKGLKKLEKLDLQDNKITYIDALRNLKKLEHLNIYSNDIYNNTPLCRLVNLKSIDISYNRIYDLTPFSNLVNLEYLRVRNNEIENLISIEKLILLKSLDISYNHIDNIDFVKDMKHLERFQCFVNKIKSIKPLYSLDKLKYLNTRSNLFPIEEFDELKKINKLVDFSKTEYFI